MEGRCEVHPFEPAENSCKECLREYCHECLVYAFGPNKPPLCVACALSAAGIRKNAKRPRAPHGKPPKPKAANDGAKKKRRGFSLFRRRKEEPEERELVVRPLPIDDALRDDGETEMDWSSPVDSSKGN